MSDRLIDEDSFYESFFFNGVYGKSGNWPRSTTLLYRIRIKTGIIPRHTSLVRPSLQCEQWNRVDNGFKHAEIIFIEEVLDILHSFPDESQSPIKQICLDIVLNYSPCQNCAHELIKLKGKMENYEQTVSGKKVNIFCDMNIKFANFYNLYKPENIRPLIRLIQEQIQLSVFNGLCDWQDFLDNVVNLSLDVQSEVFFENWNKRQDRELVDSILLGCIKRAAIQWPYIKNADEDKIIGFISKVKSVESSFECLAEIKLSQKDLPLA